MSDVLMCYSVLGSNLQQQRRQMQDKTAMESPEKANAANTLLVVLWSS